MADLSGSMFPLEKMPIPRTKRAHKKTRTGCAVCKRRRVKCDERRPRCHRCQLKGLNCSYSEAGPAGSTERCGIETENETEGQGLGKPHQCSSGSSSLASGLNDPELASEAELAQHYFSHTMHTISASSLDDRQSKIWQIFIPGQGLCCPVVRRGMLVLAAMCLHNDFIADHSDIHSSRYLETAEAHGRIFVQESRQKMQDFRQSEFDSILACSRLLCVLGFAFNQIHRRNGATLADSEAWTWLQLVRGVKATWLAISSSGLTFNNLVAQDLNSEPSTAEIGGRIPVEGIGYRHTAFLYFKETRRERFDALRSFFDTNKAFLGPQEVEDLGDAVDKLGHFTEQICSLDAPSLFRVVCRWPSHVSNTCNDLILECFPIALVVYAHWLMSVILVEDLWWVNDMGRAGIREVVDICSDNSPELQALLRWPRDMAGLSRA